MIHQFEFQLPEFPRGFHLITELVLKSAPEFPDKGLFHLFIQHSSAGLTLNENYDPTVRVDFESIFNRMVPEDQPYYQHTLEGSDDMPAHVKATLTGSSISIPVTGGKLNLGTWQGVYLCEFRNRGGRRKLVGTIIG